MFDQYPKKRPPLPDDIKKIYATLYKSNREGATTASSIAQRVEAWLHQQVAKDVCNRQDAGQLRTLELGAGTLNQLPFETRIQTYDIVEPFKALYEHSPLKERVRHIYADIFEIAHTERYDRITSIATLEHICDLPQVIAQSGLLMANNGVFRASIPSEGTWLWTLGWKLTTGLEFKLKYGLDYGHLMRHEHVNTANEIEAVLKYFFERITCRVFGLNKAISLYRYYECRAPIVERCQSMLSRSEP